MSGLFALEHLSAGYGGHAIVQDISLSIQPGEFCALLGLNGSGKTTLFKAACGLMPVMAGRFLVNGQDCTHLNERMRARFISYIPQRHSKLAGYTVKDVVLMGRNPYLGLLDAPCREDRKLAEDTLVQMGIDEMVEMDFAHLSEGQKQLVILSRALVQQAPVMLMDEPDSALDFVNKHRILGSIRNLIHAEKKAGMITLHDPNAALAYCDRLILLHEGRIESQLTLKNAAKEDIQDCLAAVYGDVEVVTHQGRFMVFMA